MSSTAITGPTSSAAKISTQVPRAFPTPAFSAFSTPRPALFRTIRSVGYSGDIASTTGRLSSPSSSIHDNHFVRHIHHGSKNPEHDAQVDAFISHRHHDAQRRTGRDLAH